MTFQRTVLPGVEIRQFQPADAEAVFAEVDRNRKFLRHWLPWVDATRSVDEVRSFIARATEQFEANLGPQTGIWIDGALAGSLGCHPIDWANRSCAIGYWISEKHQGKGIITKATIVMINYLISELSLHRIEIRCGTGNKRSCAVPERLGFVREGVARDGQWVNDRWVDLIVWSMLDRDWTAR